MSEKLEKIAEDVGGLTVLELADLIKVLEEKFGVEAAAPMAMAAMPVAAAEAADEGPSSYNVILKEIGSQKIPVIKEVRAITGLGLKEAKGVVDSAPKAIKEGVDEEEADKIRQALEAIGATVEIEAAN